MPRIIVDSREPKDIVKEFIKDNIDIEIKQLVTADFILQTKTLDGKVQNIGIERKIKNDFLNSIIDKRLLNQLIILKENFDVSILILEGEENIYKMRNFHPNSIRGMLATIAVDFQIPIIPTLNSRDTASFIGLLAKRLEKPRKPLSLLAKRKPSSLKELQESFIESLPGVGPTISKELLLKFKTVKKIMNANEKRLEKIPNLGKIKSKNIKVFLESDYK